MLKTKILTERVGALLDQKQLQAEVKRLNLEIKEKYVLAENVHLLIEESKSTCERNFGKSGLIDWFASDMHELVNELINDDGESRNA